MGIREVTQQLRTLAICLSCFSTDKLRHMPEAIIEESIYWQITVFRGWVSDHHGSKQQANSICSYSQSGAERQRASWEYVGLWNSKAIHLVTYFSNNATLNTSQTVPLTGDLVEAYGDSSHSNHHTSSRI